MDSDDLCSSGFRSEEIFEQYGQAWTSLLKHDKDENKSISRSRSRGLLASDGS
jgi:hypothetical protein